MRISIRTRHTFNRERDYDIVVHSDVEAVTKFLKFAVDHGCRPKEPIVKNASKLLAEAMSKPIGGDKDGVLPKFTWTIGDDAFYAEKMETEVL